MRPIFSLVVLAMLVPGLLAQSTARPPQAPPVKMVFVPVPPPPIKSELAPLPCDCGGDVTKCKCGLACDCPVCEPDYAAASAKAIREGKALLVWYRTVPSKQFTGCVTCKTDSLSGFIEPGLIVSVPRNGSLIYADTLPEPTQEGINAAIRSVTNQPAVTVERTTRGEVRRAVPTPFQEALASHQLSVEAGAEAVAAEASTNKAAGPWPTDVPFVDGLVKYEPAKFTQSIFKLDSRDGRGSLSTIRAVPRSKLLPKWQVPGGMEGLTGWKSDLYKRVPYHYRWRGFMPVKNTFKFFQQEIGHQREYPDGTIFMDVLSNARTGKVFEHRVREKTGGEWVSYVAFKDRAARPAGYHGLQGQTCASCHSESGRGDYGVGLNPGGDGVLSDPLPLE